MLILALSSELCNLVNFSDFLQRHNMPDIICIWLRISTNMVFQVKTNNLFENFTQVLHHLTHSHTCIETKTYSDSVCVWVQAVRLGCSCGTSHCWHAMLGYSLVQHVSGWIVLLDPLRIKRKGQ